MTRSSGCCVVVRAAAAAVVVASVAVSGCQRPPDIGPLRPLQGTTEMKPGESKAFGVEVSNPSGQSLEYRWSSQRGSFVTVSTKTPANVYTAPDTPGAVDTITVEVLGGRSLIQRTLAVAVFGDRSEADFYYEFDNGPMGWGRNEAAGTKGLVDLSHDKEQGMGERKGSLRLALKLDGMKPEFATAEVEVNLTYRNDVVGDPLNLTNRTLLFHVKCPRDFPVHKDAPHGLQPFARDDNHRSYYGCYRNINANDLDRWIELPFPVGPPDALSCKEDTSAWRQDPGFRPERVTTIGLKIGANPANKPYKGACYLDRVTSGR